MSLLAEKFSFLEESVRNIHSEIIDRARLGDQLAYREIYRLYSKAMFNTALRMVTDRSEAEDILQESFLSAFRNLKQYRGDASFGAWLKRIVVNQALNALRRRKEFGFSDALDQMPDASLEDQDNGFPYTVSQVNSAVQLLPDGYRTVLSLYLIEGYDHSEISDILSIDENTSKSQLSRAKKKLVELLQQNFTRHE